MNKKYIKYLILVSINLVTLYFIGLFPLRIANNYALQVAGAGTVPLMLAWIVWLPATIIAVILYKLVQWKWLHKYRITLLKIILVSFLINAISILSFPIYFAWLDYRQSSVEKKFNVNLTLLDERITNDVYQYKLQINNTDNIPVALRVQPLLTNDKSPGVLVQMIEYTDDKFDPVVLKNGSMVIEGKKKIAYWGNKGINPTNSKVEIEVYFIVGDSYARYFLESELDWSKVYQRLR